jgi:class 3 adenylate cyclase/alpha-beta hydrolase superfamily lysophospholipase
MRITIPGHRLSPPETHYAKSGQVHIAYQVFGQGKIDLVLVPGWASHIEYSWEEPVFARYLTRLGSFSRVIWFDKRGTGLSDRDVGMPTLEQRMDDVRAVMEAAGSRRAAIFGVSEGGSMSALFAATYPEKASHLILYGAFARRIWSEDYPWAPTLESREKWIDSLERGWGGEVDIGTMAPSRADDEAFKKWFATYGRLSVSPSAAVALAKMNTYIDIRNVLPTIHVPTLVMHRKNDMDALIGNSIYLAKNIPGAKFVELEGADHMVMAGDVDAIIDQVQEFVTGVRPMGQTDRVLSTILFTDIVDSTKEANKLGDDRWKSLLLKHNDLIRNELAKYRGREIKTTGDGFVAIFDGPGRAVQCAREIADSVKTFGISVRAGLHTGECELLGNDIAGVAVHIAARVAAMAKADEVLATSTVKDLVSGSGIQFKDKGTHSLKGVERRWHLYSA